MKNTNIFKRIIITFATIIMAINTNAFSLNSNASDEEPDYSAMVEEVIYLVNQARTEAGLEPVYAVPYLNEVATEKAEEAVNVSGQARTGGGHFMESVDYEIAPWYTAGENTATGTATAEETFEQWKNSPSQWAVIMSADFTHMGIGITYDPESVNVWYWEQLFIGVDVFERPNGDIEGQYLTTEYQVTPQITGDINSDGVIDSFDYLLLCRYINKQVTLNPQQIKCADVLRDGNVSYSDANVLRKYILGEISDILVTL